MVRWQQRRSAGHRRCDGHFRRFGRNRWSRRLDRKRRCSCVLLPEPPSVSNSTPQELERAGLMRDFCTKLGRDGCLNVAGGSSFVGEDNGACSVERRIAACEWDQRSQYSQLVIPACDDEWQAAIRCATGADYPDRARCSGASIFVASQSSETCQNEKAALGTCLGHDSTRSIVAGSRTVCQLRARGDRRRVRGELPGWSGRFRVTLRWPERSAGSLRLLGQRSFAPQPERDPG